MFVCGMYIIWLKQFKLWKVSAVVAGILVVGVVTCCDIHVWFESYTDEWAMLSYLRTYALQVLAQSAGAAEYTDCFSAEG